MILSQETMSLPEGSKSEAWSAAGTSLRWATKWGALFPNTPNSSAEGLPSEDFLEQGLGRQGSALVLSTPWRGPGSPETT